MHKCMNGSGCVVIESVSMKLDCHAVTWASLWVCDDGMDMCITEGDGMAVQGGYGVIIFL